mmetsp:Transcript_7219/g.16011  ORF Transcript_7219/g.16011 Transcript_7219/m.16011 type:complete len:747 (-) Transcript_7219:188-2428(-)
MRASASLKMLFPIEQTSPSPKSSSGLRESKSEALFNSRPNVDLGTMGRSRLSGSGLRISKSDAAFSNRAKGLLAGDRLAPLHRVSAPRSSLAPIEVPDLAMHEQTQQEPHLAAYFDNPVCFFSEHRIRVAAAKTIQRCARNYNDKMAGKGKVRLLPLIDLLEKQYKRAEKSRRFASRSLQGRKGALDAENPSAEANRQEPNVERFRSAGSQSSSPSPTKSKLGRSGTIASAAQASGKLKLTRSDAPDAMLELELLRNHPSVLAQLELVWTLTSADGVHVTYDDFNALMRRVYLSEAGSKQVEPDARECVKFMDRKWKSTTKSGPNVLKPSFFDTMCQLMYEFSEGPNAAAYVAWSKELLSTIARRRGSYFEWQSDHEIMMYNKPRLPFTVAHWQAAFGDVLRNEVLVRGSTTLPAAAVTVRRGGRLNAMASTSDKETLPQLPKPRALPQISRQQRPAAAERIEADGTFQAEPVDTASKGGTSEKTRLLRAAAMVVQAFKEVKGEIVHFRRSEGESARHMSNRSSSSASLVRPTLLPLPSTVSTLDVYAEALSPQQPGLTEPTTRNASQRTAFRMARRASFAPNSHSSQDLLSEPHASSPLRKLSSGQVEGAAPTSPAKSPAKTAHLAHPPNSGLLACDSDSEVMRAEATMRLFDCAIHGPSTGADDTHTALHRQKSRLLRSSSQHFHKTSMAVRAALRLGTSKQDTGAFVCDPAMKEEQRKYLFDDARDAAELDGHLATSGPHSIE